jgi:transposase
MRCTEPVPVTGRTLDQSWKPPIGSSPAPFSVMADLAENARRKEQRKKPAAVSPLALEAVCRIDQLFEIERAINGQNLKGATLFDRTSACRCSPSWRRGCASPAPSSRAATTSPRPWTKDYMLKRWTAFTRFLDDDRICLSNNAAERVRGKALGRKSWLFCGSDRGGERAALMYSLIVTTKINDIDPQAWLADVDGGLNIDSNHESGASEVPGV